MAEDGFLLNNFSPVGAQARLGNVPQVFSYFTDDTLAQIKAQDYFKAGVGILRRGDWIDCAVDLDGTIGQSIVFITQDMRTPANKVAIITFGGVNYTTGDFIYPTFPAGTFIAQPVYKVTAVAGLITEHTEQDSGLFNVANMPTNFTDLATTTSGGGSGAKISVFPTQSNGGIFTALVGADDGSGYVKDDLVSVVFQDGTVFEPPILKVATVLGGAVLTYTIEDPGQFDPLDPPTTLDDLSTVTLTGVGIDAEVTVTLGRVIPLTPHAGYLSNMKVSDKVITAS